MWRRQSRRDSEQIFTDELVFVGGHSEQDYKSLLSKFFSFANDLRIGANLKKDGGRNEKKNFKTKKQTIERHARTSTIIDQSTGTDEERNI